MTPRGARSLRSVFIAIILVGGFVAASLVGCVTLGLTPVAVSDLQSVAGTWEGVVYQTSSEPDHVTLTIREDGSYNVESRQPFGASRGKGTIVVKDGRLIMQGEKGRGVGTLLTSRSGDRVMRIEATLSDHRILTAELGPSR